MTPIGGARRLSVLEIATLTETAIIERLTTLTEAVASLSRLMGARLTRDELCRRLGVHRNTLARYVKDGSFPAPGKDGKWLLADVVEWEAKR